MAPTKKSQKYEFKSVYDEYEKSKSTINILYTIQFCKMIFWGINALAPIVQTSRLPFVIQQLKK